MAFINYSTYRKPKTLDEETGCWIGSDDYEECRQAFYAKKQTEILESLNTSPTQAQIQSAPASCPVCDYSSHQKAIDDLLSENTRLLTENGKLKEDILSLETKYKNVVAIQAESSNNPSVSEFAVKEFLSPQSLIFLLIAVIVALSYFLIRKRKV